MQESMAELLKQSEMHYKGSKFFPVLQELERTGEDWKHEKVHVLIAEFEEKLRKRRLKSGKTLV